MLSRHHSLAVRASMPPNATGRVPKGRVNFNATKGRGHIQPDDGGDG